MLSTMSDHEPPVVIIGDSGMDVGLAVDMPSRSHEMRLAPQVGRFLYKANFSGIDWQASASCGPKPSSLTVARGVR